MADTERSDIDDRINQSMQKYAGVEDFPYGSIPWSYGCQCAGYTTLPEMTAGDLGLSEPLMRELLKKGAVNG